MKESDMPVREWYSGSFLQNMEKSTSKARKLGDLEDEVVLFPVLGCDMIVLIEIVIIHGFEQMKYLSNCSCGTAHHKLYVPRKG